MVDERSKDISEVKEGEITARRPYDLWTSFDRMFDEFRTGINELFWPFGGRRITSSFNGREPLTDVADLGDRYELRMEVPGIPKDKITIEVTANSIDISAEHDESREEKGKNWLRRERGSVRFHRRFELPEEIKSDNTEARLENGVLTISLPKLEPKPEIKPKKIAIK